MSIAHLFRSSEPTNYGWVIDRDVQGKKSAKEYGEAFAGGSRGMMGPGNMPQHIQAACESFIKSRDSKSFKGFQKFRFRMYDDDGELYYIGYLIVQKGADVDEEACYAPLGDFGNPNAGCSYIRYDRHPEMDCE